MLTTKNRPPTSTDAKNDREALVRIAVNLVAMLGHMNADVMSMRQEVIKPALKPEFQKICHATVPPNSKFLFGNDLAKLVRDSKTNKQHCKHPDTYKGSPYWRNEHEQTKCSCLQP